MLDRYRDELPLVPGAVEAVRRLAAALHARGRVVLEPAADRRRAREPPGSQTCFAVTVSSEEVARGKPAPDVYLEAARRLGVEPVDCTAVEDSANGSARRAAAGMRVLAFPNRHYPPPPTRSRSPTSCSTPSTSSPRSSFAD